MDIANYIPMGSKNAISREDLRILTGLDDRTLRDQINKSEELIINLTDGRGYYRPLPEDYPQVIIWESIFWKRIRNEMDRVKKGIDWRRMQEAECDLYCPGKEDE